MIDHRGNNGVAAIRAGCLFERGIGDGSIIVTLKGSNPEVGLELA